MGIIRHRIKINVQNFRVKISNALHFWYWALGFPYKYFDPAFRKMGLNFLGVLCKMQFSETT
jgi:hypothetical protein